MTDLIERMKEALIRFDGLFLSRDGAADAMPFLGADALYLFPEAIKEIEELREKLAKAVSLISEKPILSTYEDHVQWKKTTLAEIGEKDTPND